MRRGEGEWWWGGGSAAGRREGGRRRGREGLFQFYSLEEDFTEDGRGRRRLVFLA